MLDLGSLRYQWNGARTAVAVATARGEVFAVVDVSPEVSDREAAFLACDAALESSRLSRRDPDDPTRSRRCRVALYNPHTAEVAVGAVPSTQVFSASCRLELPPAGQFARLIDEHIEVVTPTGEPVRLARIEPGYRSTLRSYRAHQVCQLAD